MAITGSRWWWFSAWGGGYYTVDVNIAPAQVTAQTSLYGTTGGGAQFAGIKHIRRRLPSGADQDIDFGEYFDWKPMVSGRLSSLTFGIATGINQRAWCVARVDWWD